jgi:ribosome biogenesis protein YTM1
VEELPDESVTKKKKSELTSTVKTPIITLAGHTETVSACKWIDETTVVTASWDHSIRLWDVFAGHDKQTMKSPSKIFLSIDYSPVNRLIAAGLNDSIIRLYDHRSNEGNLVKISLTSHTGWCSSVFWSRTNENLLVSGSYDNLAKLWDIRK